MTASTVGLANITHMKHKPSAMRGALAKAASMDSNDSEVGVNEESDRVSDASSDSSESCPVSTLSSRQPPPQSGRHEGLSQQQVLLGSHGVCHRNRKLIIHLDIRNTILVADSVTNVSVDEALNSFLTGVVWGRVSNGEWKWYSSAPSLKSPAHGLCTYYKYLEKNLVKNPTDRVNLRLQTGDFSHTDLGSCFREHFDAHLDRLLWDFGTEVCHNKVLTMSGRDGKPYHYILPSVYRLLQHLKEQQRDFAVILRTYGRDAPNALSSLEYGLRGHHPAFPMSFDIKVCRHPGRINREQHHFELLTPSQGEDSEIQSGLTQETDIYRHLCSSQGITGFVDDFLYWQNNNYDHAAGKPMWIDPFDHQNHHIFFDDNFRADDEDSIIDVRMFNNDSPKTSRSLEHSEIGRLEDVFLVQADLLESINDEEYFVRKIELCEQNFDKLIQSGTLV